MGASVDAVRIPITADDRFSRSFAQLKRDLADARTGLGSLTGVASRVTSVLGVGSAVGIGGFGLALRKLSDDINALNDAAAATGTTVEGISRLDVIARRNGGSLDTMSRALVKLNQSLADPNPDSRAAKALRAIGIEVADLRKQDPAAAFDRIARTLDGFADGAEKARLVQALFGEDVRVLGATLKDVAAAGEVNAAVTKQQADEAARFSKTLQRLEADVADVSRAVAGPFVSALNELFGVLQGRGPGLLDERLAVPLQAVSVLGANVAFVLRGIGTEIGVLGAQSAAVARGELSLAREIGRIAREDARAARDEFDKLERRLMQLGTAPQADYSNEGRNRARGAPRIAPGDEAEGGGSGGRRGGRAPAFTLSAIRDARQEQLQAFMRSEKEAYADVERFIRDMERTGYTGSAILDPREEQRQAFLRSEKDAYDDVERRMRDLADSGENEFRRLEDAVSRFADNSIEAILDFAETGEFSAERLFKAFQRDVLRELIEDPVRDVMRSAVDGMIEELQRADLQKVIAELFAFVKSIFSNDDSGSGGSWWGKIIGGLFSGGGGSNGSTSRAGGGGVNAGQLVRWQEGGREWFVPQENGTVLTQAQLRQMQGGGLVYSPTLHVNGDVSPQTVAMMRRLLEEERARLMRSMRHGRASR